MIALNRTDRMDAVALHRVWSPIIFLSLMLLVFQVMFSWAQPFASGIQALVALTGDAVRVIVPPGQLRSMLVGGVFGLQGLTVLGMHLMGAVAALAAVFRRTLLRSKMRALIIELPAYSLPSARVLLNSAWQRVQLFLRRAGTVIFAISILLWGLASYPKSIAALGQPATQEQQLSQSALGHLGHAIEPAVRPLGYDWKVGVSMIASVYVFALMCTSTLTMTHKETGGGWQGARRAALQFAYMLVLAYGAAFMIYHGGLALGFGGGARRTPSSRTRS